MSDEKLTLKGIKFEDQVGVFRINRDQAGWKGTRVHSFLLKDLLEPPLAFQVTACGKWSVRFGTTKRTYRFDYFQKEEIIQLQAFLKHCGLEEQDRLLKVVRLSSRGGNWGDLELSLSALTSSFAAQNSKEDGGGSSKMEVEGTAVATPGGATNGATTSLVTSGDYLFYNEHSEPMFDLKLQDILQVSNPTRNDIHVELCEDEDNLGGLNEQLTEIRFFVVNPANTASGSNVMNETNPASKTRAEMLKTEIDGLLGDDETGAGEIICELRDLRWAVPSGKFEMKFRTGSLCLHGKSQDFVIRYTNIHRLFILPGLQEELNLVLQLNSPIRQGAQSHHYLCLTQDMRVQVPLDFEIHNVKEEALVENSLTAEARRQRPFYDTIVKLLKMLTPATMILPYDNFTSSVTGRQSVSCSYKNSNGALYPLKKGMIFLQKPILHIPYSQVTLIQVQRGSEISHANRYFELSVVLSGGSIVHEFRQVAKEELQNLMRAFSERGVKVPEIELKSSATATATVGGGVGGTKGVNKVQDNSDDSDYVPSDDEDEEEYNPEEDDGRGMKRRR